MLISPVVERRDAVVVRLPALKAATTLEDGKQVIVQRNLYMIWTSYQELYLLFWTIHNHGIGIVSRSTKLGEGGVAHVRGVNRAELKENPLYSDALLINRTASPLAWFMECKDRTKHSSVMLPYTFLPTMPARKLRDATNKHWFSACTDMARDDFQSDDEASNENMEVVNW